jgi:hypothetical protein
MLYGPDCFIYDIQKLFISLSGEAAEISETQSEQQYRNLLHMAREINRGRGGEQGLYDIFILGCGSRVLTDHSGFLSFFQENEAIRVAYHRALGSCSATHAESMCRSLELRRVSLSD